MGEVITLTTAQEMISVPNCDNLTHKIYVTLSTTPTVAEVASIVDNKSIAGIICANKEMMGMFGKATVPVFDASAMKRVGEAYQLDASTIWVDRSQLKCSITTSPVYVENLLAQHKGVTLAVSGDIMFSMQFKKCSTRSEVGDVFYLCSQGV